MTTPHEVYSERLKRLRLSDIEKLLSNEAWRAVLSVVTIRREQYEKELKSTTDHFLMLRLQGSIAELELIATVPQILQLEVENEIKKENEKHDRT